MHPMDPLISISILKILILKSYGQEIREEEWIRIVMKAAKLHPVIDKKLKYFMLMLCGTEDGCHHLIFKQENEL